MQRLVASTHVTAMSNTVLTGDFRPVYLSSKNSPGNYLTVNVDGTVACSAIKDERARFQIRNSNSTTRPQIHNSNSTTRSISSYTLLGNVQTQRYLAITNEGRVLTTVSASQASELGGLIVHSRVNDSDSTSFESASYQDCYIGVDQAGHILAPNEVPLDSVSSQFILEPVISEEEERRAATVGEDFLAVGR